MVDLPFQPEQLWPFVADTDRMDRSAGLPPVRFVVSARREGGEVVRGEYRLLGLRVARWIEHPFEWEWPRHFSVRRDYESGPLLSFHGGTQLDRTPRGTRLRSFVEIVPRHGWLRPLVRFGLAPLGLHRAARQHRAIARYLAGRAPEPFPTLVRLRSRAEPGRLTAGIERLLAEGAPAEPTQRLGRLLAEAADEDVAGMRPLELARHWSTDARETLEVFVRAAVAGLVELRWELVCPRCRGVKATASHLRDLAEGGYCPTCNLHFIANQDEAIEARFYPNRGLRSVEVGTYCIGSPMKTPHRVAQTVAPPAAARAWHLELSPGVYHLSSPQSRGLVELTLGALGAPPEPVVVRAAPEGLSPARLVAAAGRLDLRLENATGWPVTFCLDDARWAETGATPGRLMTLPAFRTLLSPEALAPGFELAIGRVGLLFTDLAGSTALYERIGDARAFKLVGEHFTLLRQPIEAAGGAVVKTIGDAVMAAFPDGRSALRAGLGIQQAIRTLNTEEGIDAARLVKVGVHVGACYAVTLNDRLDYFGTAVNLAARAQHEARGGEVVASGAVLEEAQADLAANGLQAEPFEVELKGFSAPVRLFRICHPASG